MSDNNRVVWSEGLFLKPQHFQQHDRHIEARINGRCSGLRGFDWGFESLRCDALGDAFSITRCKGRFQDGTPFYMSRDDALPLKLKLPDGFSGMIYLALPSIRLDDCEIDSPEHKDSLARYQAAEMNVRDHTSWVENKNFYPLQIGRLKTRLILERLDGHECLGVAKVIEVKGGHVEFDKGFIPPSLACSVAVAENLDQYLSGLQGWLRVRGDILKEKAVEASRLGGAGLASFILLQLINRYEPLLNHLKLTAVHVHPEDFYRIGLQLAGELSTFFNENKRPVSFAAYQHDDLQATFRPLMDALEKMLGKSPDASAVRITLLSWLQGYAAPNKHEYVHCLDKAVFVLAVKADVPSERLRTDLVKMIRIMPKEDYDELVRLSLPGIELSPLMLLPPSLPSRPDFCYFGLNKHSEYWAKMSASMGFAIHISGHLPGLELEFWAVQG